MLCSKCHKEIKQGKEIQVEGSIICQECAKKPIAYCATCSPKRPLYYNDGIHKSSKNSNNNLNFLVYSRSVSSSEEVVQCDDCYKEWKKEVKDSQRLLGAKRNLIPIYIILILFFGGFLFYPNKMEWLKNNLVELLIFIVLLSILVSILDPILKINRYKTRKRNEKVENKLSKNGKKGKTKKP